MLEKPQQEAGSDEKEVVQKKDAMLASRVLWLQWAVRAKLGEQ